MVKHVMIVEDHIEIQMILRTRLELAGYSTSCARDGLEALELLENVTPDVILLDLGLPRMDGYAFLATLEQRKLIVSFPVIVLTADKQAALKLADKPVKVFTKPFSFHHLVAAIQMCN